MYGKDVYMKAYKKDEQISEKTEKRSCLQALTDKLTKGLLIGLHLVYKKVYRSLHKSKNVNKCKVYKKPTVNNHNILWFSVFSKKQQNAGNAGNTTLAGFVG